MWPRWQEEPCHLSYLSSTSGYISESVDISSLKLISCFRVPLAPLPARRRVQILHPPLHRLHAQLAEQPAGERGQRYGDGDHRPVLPGDGVPAAAPQRLQALQRPQRHAPRVRHALRHRRQVHLRRPEVSFSSRSHPSGFPSRSVSRLLALIARFRWERRGTLCVGRGLDPKPNSGVDNPLSLPLFLRRSCASWWRHTKLPSCFGKWFHSTSIVKHFLSTFDKVWFEQCDKERAAPPPPISPYSHSHFSVFSTKDSK